MIRNELRYMRDSFKELSRLERMAYVILIPTSLTVVGGIINFAPIGSTLKVVFFAMAALIIIGVIICIYHTARLRRQTRSNAGEESADRDHVSQSKIPPKPTHPPVLDTTQTDDLADDAIVRQETLKVLRSIEQSNRQLTQLQQQEAEERHRRSEKLEALLNSKTVRYDEIPGYIFFVKRGLWKMLLAWVIFIATLFITLSATGEVIEWSEVIFLAVLFLFCIWFSIRCIGDWMWLRRRIEGIRISVSQPKNAFFLLFGGYYESSIFDCGNALVKKTKYERFLLLRTATVSVDTRRQNAENDNDNKTDGDVFNAMENMRYPDKFREIVMSLHEQITLSQSDTIKRSER